MSDGNVVVVGAGPVELLLAIELALGGAKPVVLERLAAPSPTIKALGIGPLGSEALQRRGMAAAMDAEETRNFTRMKGSEEDMRDRMSKTDGHFAGLFLARPDSRGTETRGTDRCGSGARRMRVVDQQGIEALLADRARALGIEVRRACEVTGFAEEPDGVDVEWTSPAGPNHIRCSYLVGCDGGRSSIRKKAGFAFPGTPPTMTMYQAFVEVDHPDLLSPGWHRTSGGVLAFGPLPGRLFLLDFSGPPEDRQAPVTREEVEAVLRRISGLDVRINVLESGNRWTDNTRLVDTYRRGRVFLAGDAAHVHSPFGGQGLTLGLVDAANLGWKLAAVVRGEMPDSLLDSYTAERRPVAEAVLANTLAQVAIMRPDPQSGAMRDLFAKLLGIGEVSRFFGAMMSGRSTRYDLGSQGDDVGRLIGDEGVGDGNVSLYESMQDGLGVLLDGSNEGSASKLAAALTPSVRCMPITGGPSMLIRPDACIAWASETHDLDGLEDALRRWFCQDGGFGQDGAFGQDGSRRRAC